MAEVGRRDTLRYVQRARRMTWAYRVVAALRAPIVGGRIGERWASRYEDALMSYPGIRRWADITAMAATKEAVTSRRAAAIWALQQHQLPRDVVKLIAKTTDFTPLPVNPRAVVEITSAYKIDRMSKYAHRPGPYAKLLTNYQLAYLSAESSSHSTPIFAELIYFNSSHTSKSQFGQIRAAIVLWIFSDIPTEGGPGAPYPEFVNKIWNKVLTHIEEQLPWWMQIPNGTMYSVKGSDGSTWFAGKSNYSPIVSGWVRPEKRDYSNYCRVEPDFTWFIISLGPLGDRVYASSFDVPSPFHDM